MPATQKLRQEDPKLKAPTCLKPRRVAQGWCAPPACTTSWALSKGLLPLTILTVTNIPSLTELYSGASEPFSFQAWALVRLDEHYHGL